MTRKLIGIVNAYGKEVLQDTGRSIEYTVSLKTEHGIVVTWLAWEIVPDEKISMVETDANNGINVGE